MNWRDSLLLYLVTPSVEDETEFFRQTEAAIKAGVTFVQFREKKLPDDRFLSIGLRLKDLCKKNNVPFVVNDRVALGMEMDCDGVHVGQMDMNADDVRKIIGEDKILGVSAQTVEQALLAEKKGADYIGVGAVFPTMSKDDADLVDYETLAEICKAVSVPVVAIGGIGENNVAQLAGTGICGVAVISAIYGVRDVERATVGLRNLTEKVVNGD